MLNQGVCTHVLVSLKLRESADLQQAMSLMREEIASTAVLYLSGRIHQWFSQLDERGVLFIFGTNDVEEARSLMADLPLVRAGLADLFFARLGPLQPLRMLLQVP
jgi:hypothetical protein